MGCPRSIEKNKERKINCQSRLLSNLFIFKYYATGKSGAD